MPEKNIVCPSAVIQWASSKNGSSGVIPTSIRMGNGVEMPFLGLGTGGFSSSDHDAEFSLRKALDLGYKHIDITPGNEVMTGQVLKQYFVSEKLTRKELFITTKLPDTSHERACVEKTLRAQLKDLQLDYIDLFLINTPCGVRPSEQSANISLQETWKGMEDVYNMKLTRAIGLSNFNVDQIQRVYSTASVKPHNLQVEVHLHWPQKELVVLCQSLNVCLTAYAPLGSPGTRQKLGNFKASPLDEPLVVWLAEKYKKSPAQILLRQLTQRNIVVIPRSCNSQRLRENLESMMFFLEDSDMEALRRVKPHSRVYNFDHRQNHPEYPFCEFDD